MVFLLIGHILDHLRQGRLADAERTVAILPPEPTKRRERLMNPFRGAAFKQLEHFAEGDAWRYVKYQMHMIFDLTDGERYETMLACNPAQICPDACLDIRRYPPFSILGAEDNVIVETGVGIGHGSPQDMR